MVSVTRWLDTFTCSKYADRFEQLGYTSLQSICQLNTAQLQNLGVSSSDIHTIMENILLLKQSVNSLNSRRYLDLTSEPPTSLTMTHYFLPDFPVQQQFPRPLESFERLVHPPIVKNLLTNELQDDSIENNHPFITSLITPLPSIISLQQKSNFV